MTGLPMTVRIPHSRPLQKLPPCRGRACPAPTAQYTKRHLLNPEQVPFYIMVRNKTPVNYSIPSRYPWGTTSYASAR